MMVRFQTAAVLFVVTLFLAGCQGVPLRSDASPAATETGSASLLAPMVEKRDTLVGTGYAVIAIQNHKLPAQQRLLAIRASKLDAYRSLAEQVYGQYLDANTTVADMVIMNDNFRAKVEGVIYGAVVVSITPVGEDTYETTLSLDKSVVHSLRALYLSQLGTKRSIH
jgi:outer membrane protein FlgP